MKDLAFTTTELQTMLFAPPLHLDSENSCASHRDTILLALEKNDKDSIDSCLASLLNTNAEGCLRHITRSSLGVVVKDIALANPVSTTRTAKRLALLLTHEWMDLIRASHCAYTAPGSPIQSAVECRRRRAVR